MVEFVMYRPGKGISLSVVEIIIIINQDVQGCIFYLGKLSQTLIKGVEKISSILFRGSTKYMNTSLRLQNCWIKIIRGTRSSSFFTTIEAAADNSLVYLVKIDRLKKRK